MRQHPRLALLATAAALSACGAAVQETAPASSNLGTAAQSVSAPDTQTPGPLIGRPPAGQAPGAQRIDLSQPVKTQATCGDWPSSGPPTLQQYLSEVAPSSGLYRTAAIATVASAPGAPVYNSPDGKRWTQAWIAAGHSPDIYTPYQFTVQRPLTSGLATGQKITGYVEGGAMANGDSVTSCSGQPSVANPTTGRQALVIFGGNMKDSAGGPTVGLFDVCSLAPCTKGTSVVTQRGQEPAP